MLNNFIVETVNAPGTTASVNLLGAVTGRKRFRDKFSSGNTTFYYMEDGTSFECGMGVLTYGSPDTYNRATVLDNSSGTTSRINFAGTTRIYCEVPAQRALWRDSAGNLDIEGRFISALWYAGTTTGTAGAFVVALPKAVTSYAPGLEFKFRAHLTCTAAPTLNAGQGAKPILRFTSYGVQPVSAGEIGQNQTTHVVYDQGTDSFIILSTPPNGIAPAIGAYVWFAGSSLPPGCLWPDGRNVSRTTYAALFATLGTAYGAGNGSTTFGLPDVRGRAFFGVDNMGGTAANRVTSSSGITGTTLGASGGSQLMQSHNHGINDPGHAHTVNDPGHNHGVNDPGHAHGHLDRINGSGSGALEANVNGTNNGGSDIGRATDPAGTGIWLNASGTGIWLSASGTGISTQSNGSGGSQNMPPAIMQNVGIFAGAA